MGNSPGENHVVVRLGIWILGCALLRESRMRMRCAESARFGPLTF